LTSSESEQLKLPGRATHLVVQVGSSTTGIAIFGPSTIANAIDWLTKTDIRETVDDPVKSADVEIIRSHFDFSFVPLDGDSIYNNGFWGGSGAPVDVGAPIQIYTAVLGMDEFPSSAQLNHVFDGYVDQQNWESNPIKLRCRDKAARLVDMLIEDQRVYPQSGASISVEDLMQDLIDDNIHNADGSTIVADFTWNGTTTVTMSDTSEVAVGDYIGYVRAPFFKISSIVPNTSVTILNPASRTIPTGSGASTSVLIAVAAARVTLFSVTGDATTPFKAADSPGWAIKPYEQKKEHVWEALQVLTTQIGFDLRYKWNSSTSAFELTFYEPERTKTDPDWTFAQDRYNDITQLTQKRANIRNVVKVTYLDSTSGVPETEVRTNAASITKYGRRAMLIAEGGTSQIDTSTEAGAFADAALADLKEPDLDQATDLPYFWPAEIGDLYRFSANDIHYTADQDLAVVSISHELSSRSRSRSILLTRGKPAGGFKRYFEIEARAGVGAPPDELAIVAPETVAAAGGLETMIVTYKDPLAMVPPIVDWAYTECYVKTSTIPDPPSASDLKAAGRTTRFEIQDLVPGTLYYARLIMYDRSGNKSAISAEVTATIGKVEPGYVAAEVIGPHQSIGDNVGLNFNSDVNVFSRGSGFPPDRWRII
jgi:hypothetical protein